MLQEELLALRENLQPLQKKQREEQMKAEPNETYIDRLEAAIWPLEWEEQQLLRPAWCSLGLMILSLLKLPCSELTPSTLQQRVHAPFGDLLCKICMHILLGST